MEVPRHREGLHVREIEGETVILDASGERMHSLNLTAAFIWDEIDGRRSAKEIWEAVAETFGVPLETAERDTRALLAQFRELDLVA